jgi:cation transport ATPase
MEQDSLKAAWQGITNKSKTDTELKIMLQEKSHPVLKRIRKQLIIEAVSFAAFLLVYYDFFDGDRKPWYANLLLVTAIVFVLMHNVIGYRFTRQPVKGNNIQQSLNNQLSTMKTYAIVSVLSRVLVAACLLLFFLSVVTFNAGKYWMLAAVILVFVVQIGLLSRLWIRRVREIKGVMGAFSS